MSAIDDAKLSIVGRLQKSASRSPSMQRTYRFFLKGRESWIEGKVESADEDVVLLRRPQAYPLSDYRSEGLMLLATSEIAAIEEQA